MNTKQPQSDATTRRIPAIELMMDDRLLMIWAGNRPWWASVSQVAPRQTKPIFRVFDLKTRIM